MIDAWTDGFHCLRWHTWGSFGMDYRDAFWVHLRGIWSDVVVDAYLTYSAHIFQPGSFCWAVGYLLGGLCVAMPASW